MSDRAPTIPVVPAGPILRGAREIVHGWGRAVSCEAEVIRARSVDDVRAVFQQAKAAGRSVCLRGSGCSYGDAALVSGGIVLDVSGLNRILAFDAAKGVATVEPGVTIRDLWTHALPHGYWPAVVPGTMHATLGGCLAMNIHGKNSYAVGTIGEHVERATLLTPGLGEVAVSRSDRPDLFRTAVGGFGMLGCFTSITLRLKRVPGGRLRVRAFAPRSLAEVIEVFEREKRGSDYLVGWLDGFASGRELGRGILHRGDYAGPDEDPRANATLAPAEQHLPARFAGIIPRTWMRWLLRPWINDAGMRAVNFVKDRVGLREARGRGVLQSHAAFAFLLDYVPEWRRAYGPGGLIQYQSFVPAARALAVHSELITRARSAKLVPYLLVYKAHRHDDWSLTHAVDGYSLAMDFKVTPRNRDDLWRLCRSFDDLVLAAGGRFYFAKDATLTRSAAARSFPRAEIDAFLAAKREADPAGILQSDLFGRLFGDPAAERV